MKEGGRNEREGDYIYMADHAYFSYERRGQERWWRRKREEDERMMVVMMGREKDSTRSGRQGRIHYRAGVV